MVISSSSDRVRQKILYLKISTHPETHESDDFQTIFQEMMVKIFHRIKINVLNLGKSTRKHGFLHKIPHIIMFENANYISYGSIM